MLNAKNTIKLLEKMRGKNPKPRRFKTWKEARDSIGYFNTKEEEENGKK